MREKGYSTHAWSDEGIHFSRFTWMLNRLLYKYPNDDYTYYSMVMDEPVWYINGTTDRKI